MAKTLTASDRTTLIRLASTLDKGSPERKAILAGLKKTASKTTTLKADLKLKDGTVYTKGTRAEVFFSEREPSMSEVEIEGRKIKLGTAKLHRYFKGFPKQPSYGALDRMGYMGSYTTVTGKRGVEADGYGSDGSPSWVLALGLV